MDSGNNTTVNVNIGATNTAKAVLSDAIKDFSNFWKSASGGTGAEGAASSFENLANKLGLSGSKMQLVAGVATGVLAAGTVAIGVNAVKSAAGFQTLTERIVTTGGESQKYLPQVQQGLLQISSAVGVSANDMATAYYKASSAGYTFANGGLKVVAAAAQAAQMEGGDAASVTDALTSAMRDYHEPASAAADITSKMVTAVSQGKTTFPLFADSLHSVLPIASAAHISLNDILGDLASMTVHGMSADQASQNMAEAIRTLQSPSQAATQYLASLGISAQDLSTKLADPNVGLSGTLQQISTAIMDHMGPSGKVLISAFNQSKSAASDLNQMIAAMPKGVQAAAKAYEDGSMSYTAFQQAAKATGGVASATMQQFEAAAKSAQGFNTLLKSGSPTALSYSQALQKATGNATTMNVALMLTGENADYTNKAVTAVGKAHAEAGDKVKGWSDYQKTLNAQMKEAKASIDNVGIGIGMGLLPAVTMVAKAVANFLKPIADWISSHQKLAAIILVVVGALVTLVASVLLVAKAVTAVRGAVTLLNDSFLTNPWTIAIMALVVLAMLVVTHWSDVKKWFDDFWSDVKQWFSDGINFLQSLWDPLFAKIKAGWNDIKSAAQTALNWINNKIQDVTNFLKEHKKGLTDIAIVIGTLLLPAFTQMAIQATVAATKTVIAFATTAIGATTSAATTSLSWTTSAATTSFAWVTQTLPKLIASFATTAVQATINAVKISATFVLQAAKTAVAWAITFAGFAAGMVVMVAQFLVQAARMAAGWLLALGPIGIIVAVAVGAVALIIANWSTLKGYFAALWSNIKQWTSDVVNAIVGYFKWSVDTTISFWEGVFNWFAKLPGRILSAIGNAGTWLYDVGKDMIQGLINGIENMASNAIQSVKNIGSTIVGGLKGLLGIHSPSTVFAEIGQNMGQGLIQGLQGIKPQANIAVNQLVTGSTAMNNNASVPANSNTTTNNNTMTTGGTTYQTINVSLSTSAAVTAFFQSLNQDSLNATRGVAPVQGAY